MVSLLPLAVFGNSGYALTVYIRPRRLCLFCPVSTCIGYVSSAWIQSRRLCFFCQGSGSNGYFHTALHPVLPAISLLSHSRSCQLCPSCLYLLSSVMHFLSISDLIRFLIPVLFPVSKACPCCLFLCSLVLPDPPNDTSSTVAPECGGPLMTRASKWKPAAPCVCPFPKIKKRDFGDDAAGSGRRTAQRNTKQQDPLFEN